MSLKKDLAKEISLVEAEIKELEDKRQRSLAAVMQMIVAKKDPADSDDWKFFMQYTAEIDVKRDNLKELNNKLKALV